MVRQSVLHRGPRRLHCPLAHHPSQLLQRLLLRRHPAIRLGKARGTAPLLLVSLSPLCIIQTCPSANLNTSQLAEFCIRAACLRHTRLLFSLGAAEPSKAEQGADSKRGLQQRQPSLPNSLPPVPQAADSHFAPLPPATQSQGARDLLLLW